MEQTKFNQFLKEYKDKVNWYHKKANLNKKLYHTFTWTAIILSACIPFLVLMLGAKDSLPNFITQSEFLMFFLIWGTAGLSVILAIITTAQETFHFQKNWFDYRKGEEDLKNEKIRFDAGIQNYLGLKEKEKIILFVERVLPLIQRLNANRNENTQKEMTTESTNVTTR